MRKYEIVNFNMYKKCNYVCIMLQDQMDELLEKWHDQFGSEDDEKSALVSLLIIVPALFIIRDNHIEFFCHCTAY